MIKNPERSSRGGDVEGSEKTDVDSGLGPASDVASASFDPGYDLDDSLGYSTVADLKRGYRTYGYGMTKRAPGYL